MKSYKHESCFLIFFFNLGFAVPCIFNHSNKMQQSIVKLIASSYRHCSTCFGH